MTGEHIRCFREAGYCVVRALLDERHDIAPLRTAYEELIDGLATIYEAERTGRSATISVEEGLSNRLVSLIGLGGAEALDHLAPVLGVFSPSFRFRADLPSTQVPELFELMRNDALLDAIEMLIGPEIFVSPVYHLNLKLAERHLLRADAILAARGLTGLRRSVRFYDFEVARTPWHTDAMTGLADSHESRIVVAWIPLTPADGEHGLLRVVPRSHLRADPAGRLPGELTRDAVDVEAVPGDVVFMSNRLVHAATENRSDEVRLACNLRYLPVGEPSGRPFLPGFVARSRAAPRTELRNPYVWSAMWARALQHLTGGELPLPDTAKTSRRRAERISRRWRTALPSDRDWLCLPARPLRMRIVRLARRLAVAVRRRIALSTRS